MNIGVFSCQRIFEIGSILTGKVTGIQPYGAFVALDDKTKARSYFRNYSWLCKRY